MFSLALISLVLVMAASMWIGVMANRQSESGGFMKGFFLGNRGLGSWSLALTATVMSGGTFMGFPALVYAHGWVLALWIAGYMMVPLCTFAVLGKRLGQLSRQTGAITLPEMLRERFESPAVGMAASLLMVFVLSFSLVAQFKGGAIILQHVLPKVSHPAIASWNLGGQSPQFLLGLLVFTLVVVGYTVYGGFLAAVWTDLFQSVLMGIGVLILLPLALSRAGGLEAGTLAGMQAAGSGFAFGPGAGREFLPVSLAFSFFCLWSIAGMGQPATLLRLMAFRDTRTMRQAILLLAVYNTLIYLPLVLIFICARAILPSLDKPDEVMAKMALEVAPAAAAGLVLAAPFGAVMATVSAFLVQGSSALVQDIYHRFINPRASEATLRTASRGGIVVLGLAGGLAAIKSPVFLQALIVFTGGAAACAYLVPCLMAAFWPRATARGALASMVGGVLTVLALYVLGWLSPGNPAIGEKSTFAPVYLLGVAPFVWGLLASTLLGAVVSLADTPPREEMSRRFFGTAHAEALQPEGAGGKGSK